ncbi:MAG: 2'-5' RNA ligase family protein [Propionibacteriales bacterium]|nr:2'-5' RNA ligase family protein [Propionibacteriales bacterium]
MTTMGVSIAVPEPFGGELRDKRAAFGDPAAATVPSHVTLLPPFEVADDEVEALAESLTVVASAHEPFVMSLRSTGTFRPDSPVVFIPVSEGISNIEMLAAAVRQKIGDEAAQFPFHPHVTVAHHLDDASLDHAFADLAHYEATFSVHAFVLYKHEDSTGWVPSMEFSLG